MLRREKHAQETSERIEAAIVERYARECIRRAHDIHEAEMVGKDNSIALFTTLFLNLIVLETLERTGAVPPIALPLYFNLRKATLDLLDLGGMQIDIQSKGATVQ